MVQDCFKNKSRLARWIGAVLLASLLPGGAALAAADDSAIAPPLQSWESWVLHGQEAWLCPEVEGEHDRAFCAWPGELKLEIARQNDGMKFSQDWDLQYQSAVPLPGNRKYWPQQVTVDGKPYPVLASAGAPVVWLAKGRHAVSGWIAWQERPQAIDVPENVALVSLAIDGKPVLPLERHDKALALGPQEDTATRVGDSLEVQVVRKLTDGIPARLTTRLRLKVSGKAREWSLPDVLPAHFVPVRIASPWAARLDGDGRLQAQVMPGQAMIEIEARLDQPLESVEPLFSPERAQEVWSYEAAPGLRTTVVAPGDNMLNVDPRQAGVPSEWLSLPAFVLNPGAQFRVEQRSRGQDARESQRLTLRRDMWLDFSGQGFFAQDRIDGTMRQGWRFDVAAPYRLERADSLTERAGGASNDPSAALLVTAGANPALTGVEWHQMNVTLNAGVRLAADAFTRVPVTGWQQSFDDVRTTLRMPYGYRLIAAPGAESVSRNAWVEQWTILDIFLAAFFALLAWRLFGLAGGAVAVLYLALGMHEAAPLWSFAAVIVLALLRRALPQGRLRKALHLGERLALLCFICMAVVFIPVQLRTALYPQLEDRATASLPGITPVQDRVFAPADLPPPAPASAAATQQFEVEVTAKRSRKLAPMEEEKSSWSSIALEPRQRYAQSTITQTGGGEPAWKLGNSYVLHWSGPITEGQTVRLLVSPPWLTRLLRVLVVALLAWLLWRSIRTAFPGAGEDEGADAPARWRWRKAGAAKDSVPAPSVAAALCALCLAGVAAAGLGFPAPASAAATTPESNAFPPADLRQELKDRLLEPPECSPACADIAEARIAADAAQLSVVLVAHVEAASTLALPAPDEQTTLRAVRVDGQAQPVLRAGDKNFIALPRGIHQVQLDYALHGDTAALGFPVRPARVAFSGALWQADGLDEGRLLGETLNLSRAAAATPPVQLASDANAAASPSAAQQFPPFVQVQRDLVFDLDWNVRTQVTRVAPQEGGFTFPVPLLPGEHVTTPDLKVQDGRALAVFATKSGSASWTSRLDKTASIELHAPPLTDYAETWRVIVNPTWHLEWSGVPVTLASTGADNVPAEVAWRNTPASQPATLTSGDDVVFEFHPLPGEKLTLTLTQPAKIEGGVRAIDRVRLENHVGQHASDIVLDFSLRASQGGEHQVTLPADMEVLAVRRNGMPLDLQPRDNRLSLPVSPGMQTYTIRLRHQGDPGLLTASPGIDLGLPSANIDLRTVLGEQRWILAARGPAVGPAVLYWGELVVALILAFLLARSGISSLKRWQWFLLALGFSTFSWLTLLVITLWLLAIDWRVRCAACRDWPARRFNAMQAGIVLLTLAMLAALVSSVPAGLLGAPNMGIRGYGSLGNDLSWFADRSDTLLPTAAVFSLPIWLYRALMLIWTLWLANILIRWLGKGLSAWLKNGYWKNMGWSLKKKKPAAPPPAVTDKLPESGAWDPLDTPPPPPVDTEAPTGNQEKPD